MRHLSVTRHPLSRSVFDSCDFCVLSHSHDDVCISTELCFNVLACVVHYR